MTTRIGASTAGSGVELMRTATRVTPYPAQPFKAVLRNSASAVISGAESAVAQLPGGPVLAAAVRDTTTGVSGVGSPMGGVGGAASGAPGGTQYADPAEGSATTSSGGSLESALSRQAEDNMYYLGLQQRIQDENRNFTTLSNVLKARHDTVKNSISNLR